MNWHVGQAVKAIQDSQGAHGSIEAGELYMVERVDVSDWLIRWDSSTGVGCELPDTHDTNVPLRTLRFVVLDVSDLSGRVVRGIANPHLVLEDVR